MAQILGQKPGLLGAMLGLVSCLVFEIFSEKSFVKLSEGDFISEGGVFLWLHVNMVMIWSIYNHLFPVYYRWQNLCSPITRLQILTSGNIDGRNKLEVKERSAWTDA